jgi:hypothetical protein
MNWNVTGSIGRRLPQVEAPFQACISIGKRATIRRHEFLDTAGSSRARSEASTCGRNSTQPTGGSKQGESVGQVQRFYAGHDPGYTIVSDADSAVGNQFGVSGLPSMVVVDANGKQRSAVSGVPSYARLERMVTEAEVP